MKILAPFILHHRVAVLMMAAAITAAALVGMTRLRFDDQVRRIFHSGGPEFERLDRLFADFGSDDRECLVVVESPRLFSNDAIATLRSLVPALREVRGVKNVRSILDIAVFDGIRITPLVPAEYLGDAQLTLVKEAALAHPLASDVLLSADGTVTLVIVELEDAIDEVREIEPVVSEMQRRVDEALSAQPAEGILKARITGVPPLRVEIIESVRRDQIRFLAIGATLGILVAWIIFKHLAAVAIVAGVPVIGASWAMGAQGWIGEPVNVINAVLPTLVMVIGFTDSVHLMVDIRRSRAQGLDARTTSVEAVRHLGLACALTSFTTMVGFGSLSAATVTTIQRFGIACAGGTVITFLAVITLVPVLASLVTTPRLVTPEQFHKRELKRRHRVAWLEPFLRHPRLASMGGILITIGLVATAFQLEPDNRLSESVPSNQPSAGAMRVCDEKLGGILQLYVVVNWPAPLTIESPATLEAVSDIHELLDAEPELSAVVSIQRVLRALPGFDASRPAANAAMLAAVPADLMRRLVRRDLRRTVVIARVPDLGAIRLEHTFHSIESALAKFEAAHPGFEFELTGTTPVAARNVRLMISDLARSLGLASVVILLVLSIAFRSLRLGLISIVPNVFPLAATAGLLVVLGKPLQITSVIVFSVCLGIAVDDTIHFISRFRRELNDDDSNVVNAIRRAFVAVGSALFITTVVLLAGFGAGITSGLPAIRWYAFLSCFALVAALAGDLFILPALLACFVRSRRSTTSTASERGHSQQGHR